MSNTINWREAELLPLLRRRYLVTVLLQKHVLADLNDGEGLTQVCGLSEVIHPVSNFSLIWPNLNNIYYIKYVIKQFQHKINANLMKKNSILSQINTHIVNIINMTVERFSYLIEKPL